MIKIKTLQPIIDAKLPGFYVDVTDSLCMILGPFRISCYVDQEDDAYVISVDKLDANGDFAKCIGSVTKPCHKTAIQELRWRVKDIYHNLY